MDVEGLPSEQSMNLLHPSDTNYTESNVKGKRVVNKPLNNQTINQETNENTKKMKKPVDEKNKNHEIEDIASRVKFRSRKKPKEEEEMDEESAQSRQDEEVWESDNSDE